VLDEITSKVNLWCELTEDYAAENDSDCRHVAALILVAGKISCFLSLENCSLEMAVWNSKLNC
jgi:hypothetical protein